MNLFQKHRFPPGFSVPKIILVKAGLMPAIHNVTCSPSLAENDFRLLKNSEGNRDGEWIFFSKEGGRRCFILASDKNEKDHKNLRSKLN